MMVEFAMQKIRALKAKLATDKRWPPPRPQPDIINLRWTNWGQVRPGDQPVSGLLIINMLPKPLRGKHQQILVYITGPKRRHPCGSMHYGFRSGGESAPAIQVVIGFSVLRSSPHGKISNAEHARHAFASRPLGMCA